MKKGLQKILLLIAVLTMVGHTLLPHIHHDDIPVAIQDHHHDEQPAGHPPHDNEDTQDNQHHLFSFAQLDENFVPVTGQINSFELPILSLPYLVGIYLSLHLPVNTKTVFGSYKVFLPPDKYYPSSLHRGPPTV